MRQGRTRVPWHRRVGWCVDRATRKVLNKENDNNQTPKSSSFDRVLRGVSAVRQRRRVGKVMRTCIRTHKKWRGDLTARGTQRKTQVGGCGVVRGLMKSKSAEVMDNKGRTSPWAHTRVAPQRISWTFDSGICKGGT